ncbi:MAG: MFS transporter [Actinobacteria bacterium]|nr:MFS transporter [Actinomycetota bacterium]
MDTRQVLSQPYVKRLFAARFISNLGNGMGPIALAFGILGLPNGSANLLGLVLGTTTVFFLLMAPFGGVIADKYGRARMVGITDFLAGLVLLVQAWSFATGDVPVTLLLIVNGLYGVFWGIFWPAFSGIIPAVVPSEGLQKGNALNQLLTNSGFIIGAACAGILIDQYGAAVTLAIDAASFMISGVMIYSFRHLTPRALHSESTVLADLRHGWQVFVSFRWIVVSVLSWSFLVMCWAAAENVLGPLIALEHFNGAKSWSLVITSESVGLIVGSVIALRIKLRYPLRFLQLASFTLTFYIFTMAKPQSLIVIASAAFLFGITLDLWGTFWNTAMQKKVPQEALSRVASFDAMGSMMFRPIGLAIAAPLSGLFGIENFLYILVGVTVVAITLPFLNEQVRIMSFEDIGNDQKSLK